MKVVIATKNPGKIEGAKKALEHYYDDINIIGIPTPSDVSDQPVNDEIMQGAKNRVSNLKKYCLENGIEADQFLAIESGMTNSLGEWIIINVAVIEDNDGFISWGTSHGFPVPNKYVEDIKEKELGPVMDKVFNENDLRSGKGGISLLTDGIISRLDMTESAFVMALIQHRKHNIWSDKHYHTNNKNN
ncbi:MAG: inosine/xanthosine triphosphatase [Bacilli bacterium]|nr:inosine/xanthosine triphosphatase [Bacilli bacterium]